VKRECIRVPSLVQYEITSHVVRAGGLVFTTGTLGVDAKTGKMASDEIRGQGRQALENLKTALEYAGTSMDNVVKVTCYYLNLEDKIAFNEIYREYFKKGMPARIGIGAASLSSGAVIEMDAIATMPD
jgi:2-iminobutanoate/2-iminopropanoate deaminase